MDDANRFRAIVEAWVASPDLEGTLVHVEHLPPRDAIHAPLVPDLPPLLAARLAEKGITELYRHQVRAIDHVRNGRHTVVVAGTASGKTLAYLVPIVETQLTDPKATALLLFPTKALAHDQLRRFTDLGIPEVAAEAYDGDTDLDSRARVRRRANVVLTNPDMLHIGILGSHDRWADFFHRLEYVVVDEMHTLRGIFGTHVALILRRLRRIAAHYGSSPTFVLGSATIGNPGELGHALTGLDVEVVDEDTSPTGARTVAMWNPPVLEEDSNRRRSSLGEATDLFLDLVRRDERTIVFARSRKATELLYRSAHERLPTTARDRIAAYRGGYLPAQRRAVEARLFSGQLTGIVTTTALELGIDVGGLDAAVLSSFPGTISGFRQQAGRAGRARDESLVALVGGEDALDQYFMNHPHELFTRPPESAVINPSNPMILEAHTACAANELPLTPEDREILGDGMEEAANRLTQQGHLRLRDGKLFWARRQRPASQIDIRASGGPTYHVSGPEGLLGTLDEERALRDGHEGAVYLHQGETFVVNTLDLVRREIRVAPAQINYYTQPSTEKILEIIDEERADRLGPVRHALGRLRVETLVVGYRKLRLGTREVLETVELDLPSTVFETQGIWFSIPESVLDDAGIDARSAPGALHAAEHAAIALMPLMAICDRWDIGGLSTPWHPQLGGPTIFIYEAYAGGAGISPVAYDAGVEHLTATRDAIRDCPCLDGCPSCVQSPKCGNGNDPLDKAGAVRLLDAIASG
ncbi:MAG: DEAD/DEAH box helicase [Acidimicrobiia bacterium]